MVVLVPVLSGVFLCLFAMTQDFLAGLFSLAVAIALFWPLVRATFDHVQEQNEKRKWRRLMERG